MTGHSGAARPDPSHGSSTLDVAIVGAGPVGVFLAVLLAEQGLDIQVFERRNEPGRHSRAIGIHPPSLEALAAAGLAEPLVAEAVKIRSGQLRSQGRSLGGVSFDRVSKDFPFIASLQQHRTETILAAKLERSAPGALHRGVNVTSVERRAGWLRVHWHRTDDGGTGTGAEADDGGTGAGGGTEADRGTTGLSWVDARIVVGADGAHSLVRAAAGIGTREVRYRDSYLMGDFSDTTGDGSAAVIWLELAGVVESFPLPGGIRRWVVRTPERLVNPTAEQLTGIIADRTGERVAAGTNSMLSAFAVRGRLARTMYRDRIVLVGDAAHEVSPIGGQGMNLGWLDAAAVAPVIVEAIRDGIFPGGKMDQVDRVRMRAAGVAARHAQVNMAMGRPYRAWVSGPRNAVIRLLLSSPVGTVLARAYSMRWL